MSRQSALTWRGTVVVSLWFAVVGVAKADDWSPLWSTARLSQARENLAATSAGSKVFFGGGGGNVGYSDVVDIYDTATGVWSTTQLSQARLHLAAASAGNKVLFAGGMTTGFVDSSVVDIFDTSTGTWSTTDLSLARSDLAGASVGSKVIFTGGPKPTVDICDTSTGLWSTSKVPALTSKIAGATAGDKVVFGGAVGTTTVDIYDGSTGLWSTTALSQSRFVLSATSAGNKVFFGGGQYSDSTASSVVDIYDTSAGSWATANLSQARMNLAAASVGNKVLFGGGGTTNGGGCSSVVDIYDTSTGLWSATNLSQARRFLAATSAGNKAFFAGGQGNLIIDSNVVDIYTLQSYPSISSTQTFTLQDNTTVSGLMQLNGGSLGLASYNLAVGSMGGSAPINLSTKTLTTGSDNTSTSYSGVLRGSGGIVKTGTGWLALAANCTYTGPTTVSQGKLLVSGALDGTAVNVGGGAALGGNGSIAGQVTLAGGSTPAAQVRSILVDGAIGTLTLSDTSAAHIVLTIGGTALFNPSVFNFEVGTAADRLFITSGSLAVNLGGGIIHIMPVAGFGPGVYDLFDFPEGRATGLDRLVPGETSVTVGANTYGISLRSTSTSEQVVVTPEPPTLVLLGSGAIGLAGWAWRRRRKRPSASLPRAECDDEAGVPGDGPAILTLPSRRTEATRRAA